MIYYLQFCRASNLILNLFSLMINTTIPDIAIEPDKTVKKVSESEKKLYTERIDKLKIYSFLLCKLINIVITVRSEINIHNRSNFSLRYKIASVWI